MFVLFTVFFVIMFFLVLSQCTSLEPKGNDVFHNIFPCFGPSGPSTHRGPPTRIEPFTLMAWATPISHGPLQSCVQKRVAMCHLSGSQQVVYLPALVAKRKLGWKIDVLDHQILTNFGYRTVQPKELVMLHDSLCWGSVFPWPWLRACYEPTTQCKCFPSPLPCGRWFYILYTMIFLWMILYLPVLFFLMNLGVKK